MAAKKAPAKRKPKGAQLDPSFEGALDMSGAEFHSYRNMAVRYYYETYKISDLIKDLYAWMKDIGYKADQIRDIKTVGSDGLSASVIYAVCLRKGMPDLHPEHNEYWKSLGGTVGDLRPVSESLKDNIDKVLSKVRPAVNENATVEDKKPQRSVQDYMRDKASTIGGYVEQVIDDFVEGEYKNPEKFSVMEQLRIHEAPAQAIDIIRNPLQFMLEEMQEVQEGKCDQLKEGYGHLGKIQVRNFIKFLEQSVADCDNYIQLKKATRKPRAIKKKTPAQLVKTFKYCKEFAELNLKSESPTKLVDASEAWLYNTKTRKLIHVVADEYSKVFTVKGSSIVGLDTAKTVMKTLRKPAEQLKQITGVGKPAARKNFNDIKAMDIKFNGRGNEHIIILKAH
jgi:hypothetical protein